ncbi:MAG: hypothetical protein GY943_30630, partial [Chloroflexi bacterium]|nr:hypothetical protein [Chloroflexota bacterium]
MANPTASEIMGYIQSKGYSRSAAAAMVGNISVETPKFNPAKSHDDGMGIGLFGHQKDRRHSRNPQIGLRAFARARGKTERDWKTQIDFAIHEIETKPAYAQTHRALTNPNLTEAQKASVFSVNFERPGTPHLARRMSNATRYMRAAPAQSYTQTPKTGPVPIFAARQTIDDMPVSLRTAAAMPTARPPTMIAEVPAAVQPEYSIPRKTSYFTSTPAEIAARPPSKTFDNHINVDAPPINASLTGSALGGSTAIQGIDVNSIPGLFSGSPKDEIDALRNYADGIQTNPSLDAGRFDRANPVNSIDNMAGALEDAALSPNGTPIGPWATGYTPQSATPAFDGQSLGAPGLLGMPPVGDPAIQQDKDIGQLAALGFFGDPLPEDPLTPTITPPPVRTDPDIYDWGTPATTPTTTTATAPATTLAPLDDDMSYRLGGTPA